MSLTKKQQAIRAYGIGASEIGVLAGLSRWSTVIDIFERKMLLRAGKEEPELDGLPAKLGTLLEDPIADIWAEQEQRVLFKVHTLKHPELELAVATPDRAVFLEGKPDKRRKLERHEVSGAEKLAQIKSTSWRLRHEWGEQGTDQVPEAYLAQGTWEMGVAGVPRLDFVVLFDKDEICTYPLHFSQPLFDGLYEIAQRFDRDHLQTRKPPPPDASEHYKEFLDRRYAGNAVDVILPASPSLEELVLRWAKLREASKRLESHKTLAENTIRATIGENTGISSPRFGKITWKPVKLSQKTDWEAVAKEAQTDLGLLFNALRDVSEEKLGPTLTAALPEVHERMRTSSSRLTKPSGGYRRLYAKLTGEAETQLDVLQLALTKLEQGDTEEEAA